MRRAFAHLNLTRNPFGEPERTERADLAIVDIEEYVERLAAPGAYVEFIGKQGRGKTTRLLALDERLDDATSVRIPEDPAEARETALPRAPILLVDDAQFLSDRQRRQLFARAGSVATATHDTLVPHAKSAGFETLEVEVRGLGPERLRSIIERRIEWARRDRGDVPEVGDEAIEYLLETCDDDLRLIEDVLYMVFQSIDDVRCIQGDDVAAGLDATVEADWS